MSEPPEERPRLFAVPEPPEPEPPGPDASEEDWALYASRLPATPSEVVLSLLALRYPWEERRALLEAWEEGRHRG